MPKLPDAAGNRAGGREPLLARVSAGDRWAVLNALALAAAAALSLLTGATWPLAAVAVASFSLLVVTRRGQWTDEGAFGLANVVTGLRVLATAVAAAAAPPGSSIGSNVDLAALLAIILALDGVDGWIARRTGTASAFGAQLDMEADALLVLVAGVAVWQRGGAAAWVLSSGFLRYAYVLCLAIVPARGGDMPRSRWGRWAFVAVVVGLLAALAFPGPVGAAAAALGTAAVGISFARSFWWSYATPSAQPRKPGRS